MIDARHGQRIPNGRKLGRALGRLLNQEFQSARQVIELGQVPDFERLKDEIFRVAIVALGIELVTGYNRTFRRLNHGNRRRPRLGAGRLHGRLSLGEGVSGSRYRTKAAAPFRYEAGPFVIDFNLFRPEVRIAAEQAAMALAGVVTEDTRELVRSQLAVGLEEGVPTRDIANQIREAGFGSKRAYLIAQTESSRAMHAGQALAATELGVMEWTWLASSDACEKCLSVDGKTVRIGEPFYIHRTGRPQYRVVTHAPLHPGCMCDNTEEVND